MIICKIVSPHTTSDESYYIPENATKEHIRRFFAVTRVHDYRTHPPTTCCWGGFYEDGLNKGDKNMVLCDSQAEILMRIHGFLTV